MLLGCVLCVFDLIAACEVIGIGTSQQNWPCTFHKPWKFWKVMGQMLQYPLSPCPRNLGPQVMFFFLPNKIRERKKKGELFLGLST